MSPCETWAFHEKELPHDLSSVNRDISPLTGRVEMLGSTEEKMSRGLTRGSLSTGVEEREAGYPASRIHTQSAPSEDEEGGPKGRRLNDEKEGKRE